MAAGTHWKLRGGLAAVVTVAVAALCVGGAGLLAPAQAGAGAADRYRAADTWRVTEHPGAGLSTDPADEAAREIYPGSTLGELGYSGVEAEWALHQKPLGDATSVIEEDFAGDYALAYFGPERTFTIGFTGSAPVGALALLDDTGLPYTTFEDLGFTDPEYSAAVDRVHGEVSDTLAAAGLLPDVSLMTAADPEYRPGAIVVTIGGDTEGVRQAALDAAGAVSIGSPFSVRVEEGGDATIAF
jgi:hypothetical protein